MKKNHRLRNGSPLTVAKNAKNRFRRKRSGSGIAAIVLLVLILAALCGYFAIRQARKSAAPPAKHSLAPIPKSPAVAPFKNSSAVLPPAALPPVLPPEYKVTPETTAPRPEEVVRSPEISGSGRLAIIIDDMGSSISEARTLSDIGVPLTFSVIPGLQKYREVAAFASSRGIEMMIHMPMQSKGWPGRRLENNGLLVAMEESELRDRVSGYIRELPGAVGANNHTGSEFTEHGDKMRSVLGILKENGLFFIDSVTTPRTTGISLARELGVRSGRRNVFLDNEQERSYILGQLNQAVRQAKRNGSAIAICHPHPATIAVLAAALPDMAKRGITLVPASRLVN